MAKAKAATKKRNGKPVDAIEPVIAQLVDAAMHAKKRVADMDEKQKKQVVALIGGAAALLGLIAMRKHKKRKT